MTVPIEAPFSVDPIRRPRCRRDHRPVCRRDRAPSTRYRCPMDFTIPDDYQELLTGFRAFLDREVRPVEDKYQPQIQDDVFTDEMRQEGLALRRASAALGFYAAH